MTQLALFGTVGKSPICCYDPPCPQRVQLVYGAETRTAQCVTREFQCLTCGRRGVQSTRTDL